MVQQAGFLILSIMKIKQGLPFMYLDNSAHHWFFESQFHSGLHSDRIRWYYHSPDQHGRCIHPKHTHQYLQQSDSFNYGEWEKKNPLKNLLWNKNKESSEWHFKFTRARMLNLGVGSFRWVEELTSSQQTVCVFKDQAIHQTTYKLDDWKKVLLFNIWVLICKMRIISVSQYCFKN